jgi:heme-NO-binding protein
MMGHVCNMLVKMVHSQHGDAGVARLLDAAGVSGERYHPEVLYPESEFQALFAALTDQYGGDRAATQRAVADYWSENYPRLFPAIYEEAGDARALLTMIPTIHKQWPSAASAWRFREKLWILREDQTRIVFKYDSPNQLCGVLRHMAQGVLDHFGEPGTVSELQCVHQGAAWCEVQVRFGCVQD